MHKNWRWGWGSAVALLLAACATSDTESGPGSTVSNRRSAVALQSQREAALQSTWRDQPYEALFDAYGAPTLVLKVPGRSPWVTLVAVYGTVDKVSGCVDAYTLVLRPITGQWTIANCFCR